MVCELSLLTTCGSSPKLGRRYHLECGPGMEYMYKSEIKTKSKSFKWLQKNVMSSHVQLIALSKPQNYAVLHVPIHDNEASSFQLTYWPK